MDIALLALRIVVGALFFGHGTQKLFGWFGGHGPKGTAQFFEGLGLRPALPLAILAGLLEACGGLLLGLGLFVPLAALFLVAVMTTAIAAVHWQHGIWSQDGGLELPLVMATVAFAVAAIGPGTISLDNAFGISWAGLEWAIAAVGIAAVGGLTALLLGRTAVRGRRGEPKTA